MARDATIRTVLTASDQASGPLRAFQNSLRGVQSEMGGVNDMAGMLKGGIAGIAAAAGVDALMQLAQGAMELGRAGEQSLILRDAFEQTASGVGASASSMLSDLQAASGGMIANNDLMLAANRAMMLGVADTSEEMAQLLEVAAVRGRAMGLSTSQAFNDLVTGLGRMSPLILDNLGIVTGGEKVFEDYAKSIHKTADALTDAERKQALFNKVVQSTDTSGEVVVSQFERMDTAIQDAKVAMGELFSPAVAAIAQQIADATNAALDAAKEQAVIQAKGDLFAKGDSITGMMDAYADAYRRAQEALTTEGAGSAAFKNELTNLDMLRTSLGYLVDEYNAAAKLTGVPLLNATELMSEATGVNLVAAATDKLSDSQQRAANAGDFFAGVERSVANAASIMQGALDRAGGAVDNIRGKLIDAAAAGMNATQALGMFNAAKDIQDQAKTIEQWLGRGGDFSKEDIAFYVDVNTERAQKEIDDLLGGFNEVENTIKSITNLTPGLLNNMSFDEALQWQAEQEASLRAQAESLRDQGYTNEQIAQYLRASVMETQAWAGGLDKVAKATNDIGLNLGGIETTLSGLQGKVQSAVQAATSLDPVGVNPDDFLPREDAVQENAFRLAAIMNEGLGNQPWLEEFKQEVPGVFDELVASGDIRGKAAEILQQFQAGLRPELLDVGLLKEQIKNQLAGEAAMQATAKQITAELVLDTGGDAADIQKLVNDALGLGGSDLTGNIVADLTSGDFTGQLGSAGATAGQTWNSSFAAQVTPPALPEPTTALDNTAQTATVDLLAGPLIVPPPAPVTVPLVAGALDITQPPPVQIAILPDTSALTGAALPDIPGVSVAVVPDTTTFSDVSLPDLPGTSVVILPDVSAWQGFTVPDVPGIQVAVAPDTTLLNNVELPDLPGISVAIIPDVTALNNLPVLQPVTLGLEWNVNTPQLPEFADQIVAVDWQVSTPQLPELASQTVDIDWAIFPLELPAIPEQSARVQWAIAPLEIPPIAPVQVPIVIGSLDIPTPDPLPIDLQAGPLQIIPPPAVPVELFVQPLEIAPLPAIPIETVVEPPTMPVVPPLDVAVQWLVDAPELPTIGTQTVGVDWAVAPLELNVQPVTVELSAGPLAITQPPPLVVDVDVNPVDVAGKIAAALGLGVKNAQLTDGILGELNSATFTARLEGSANRNGQQWGNTFLTTVQNNVPAQLIGLLTDLVTPGVVARLQQQDSLTGPME